MCMNTPKTAYDTVTNIGQIPRQRILRYAYRIMRGCGRWAQMKLSDSKVQVYEDFNDEELKITIIVRTVDIVAPKHFGKLIEPSNTRLSRRSYQE